MSQAGPKSVLSGGEHVCAANVPVPGETGWVPASPEAMARLPETP